MALSSQSAAAMLPRLTARRARQSEGSRTRTRPRRSAHRAAQQPPRGLPAAPSPPSTRCTVASPRLSQGWQRDAASSVSNARVHSADAVIYPVNASPPAGSRWVAKTEQRCAAWRNRVAASTCRRKHACQGSPPAASAVPSGLGVACGVISSVRSARNGCGP